FGASMRFGMTTRESRAAYERSRENELQVRLARAFEEREKQRVDELLSKAGQARARGDQDGALEALAAVLTIEPDEPRAEALDAETMRDKAAQIERSGDLAAAAVTFGQGLSEA